MSPPSDRLHRAGHRVDLWLALLAGPMPWTDPDRPAGGLETATAVLEVVATAAMLSWSVLEVGSGDAGDRSTGATDALLVALLVILAIVLVGPTLRWVVSGRKVFEGLWARPRLVALGRSAAVIGVILTWSLHSPHSPVLAAWPFGVAAGSEVALTIWAIGIRARPLLWWRRFLVSGPHLGSCLALLIIGFARRADGGWRQALMLFIVLHVVVGVSAVTLWALDRTRIRFEREVERREQRVLEEEHRRRAHWLHDEVCTRLGFVQQRVANGDLAPPEVASELRSLDHTLRERQLEELLGTGEVELAEVVQPYLRMAQQQGVRISAIPTYEQGAVAIDGDVGHVAKRVLANLVGNAIKAGASEVGVGARREPDGQVLISVVDDAGGFDASTLIPGRGLDRLAAELGRDRLVFRRTQNGMRIEATIVAPTPAVAGAVQEVSS